MGLYVYVSIECNVPMKDVESIFTSPQEYNIVIYSILLLVYTTIAVHLKILLS